mmetsp:Transcript_9486/g.24665  ORF Transcript_9486/g.24665 Transcript_9486/m.24665 type:complete len:83 (+) Transcript_9486:224-472(+)
MSCRAGRPLALCARGRLPRLPPPRGLAEVGGTAELFGSLPTAAAAPPAAAESGRAVACLEESADEAVAGRGRVEGMITTFGS